MSSKEKLIAIIAARATAASPNWERNVAVRNIPYVMGYGYTTHGEDVRLRKVKERFILDPQELLDYNLEEDRGYKNWRTDLDKTYGFTDTVVDKDSLIEFLTVDNVKEIIDRP